MFSKFTACVSDAILIFVCVSLCDSYRRTHKQDKGKEAVLERAKVRDATLNQALIENDL